MKEITFPELYGVTQNGTHFGLAEFLTDFVFTRPDLLKSDAFCEMVIELQPHLMSLRGASQVGRKWRVSDEHQKLLLETATPDPRLQLPPEGTLMVAHNRLAISRAVQIKIEQPTEDAPTPTTTAKNGAAKSQGKHA